MRPGLPALLLAVPLACARADEGAKVQAEALKAATEEMAAVRAAFEADRAATSQERRHAKTFTLEIERRGVSLTHTAEIVDHL